MKWQLLLVGLFLLACVGSVGAVRENFQSWGSNTPISSVTGFSVVDRNSTTGQIELYAPLYPSNFI